MSHPETPESEPLNPTRREQRDESRGPVPAEGEEEEAEDGDDDQGRDESTPLKSPRDALYIRVFYALSCAISLGGLGCGIWGYCIVMTAPFDEWGKKRQRASYESNFLGMQSVLVFVSEMRVAFDCVVLPGVSER